MPARKKIAIVGAGAKAAAICARAAAIHRALPTIRVPEIKVYEATSSGAHWRGGPSGYSDGKMRLCTSLKARDLTHRGIAPLDDDATIGRLDSAQRAAFGSELVSFRWTEDEDRPTHSAFADHVASTIVRAQQILEEQILFESHEVRRVRRERDAFTLEIASAGVLTVEPDLSGVIVTSPGPPVPPRGTYWVDPRATPFVTNTRDYWTKSYQTPSRWQTVVFIGSGGAAAAVALSVMEELAEAADEPGPNIVFVSPQPTILSRGHGIFEESLLCDADGWSRLTPEQREEMRSRMVSGVIFESVIRELSKYVAADGEDNRVTHEPGRVSSISLDARNGTVVVAYRDLGGTLHQLGNVGLVVDARGFDGEWFLSLLDDDVRAWTDDVLRRERRRLGDYLDSDLRLRVPGPLEMAPWIHAPMLAGFAQPPGLANLLNLGEMARRILDGYLERRS